MKIDCLIPARNEAEALPVLLGEIDRSLLRQIVVVDNGSIDATPTIAEALGCRVVACPTPGYGRACLAGLHFLEEDPPDILVFLDGDRSDHPKYISALVAPIVNGHADFVLGSRTLGQAEAGSLTGTQKFGNWLATMLMRRLWGFHYSDLAPFRAIRWVDLKSLAMKDLNFGWTIEMQIKAGQQQLRILEIPVDYRNRIGVSKISGTLSGSIRAGYKILYTIFRFRLARFTHQVPARKAD